MESPRVVRWVLIVGAGAVAIHLLGCGDGAGGEEKPPGPFSFMQSRAHLRAVVHCRARYQHCPGKPPVEDRALTPRQCVERTVRTWQRLGGDSGETFGLDGTVLQAVDAGAIDYDAEAADRCLEGFRSYVDQLSCIQARRLESLVVRGVIERDLVAGCSEVFTPTTEQGKECETDRECVDALVCRRTSEDSGDCGRCRSPEHPGGGTNSGFSYAREGESCGSPTHTPTCDPTEPMVCESDGSGGWICQPQTSRGEGEPCRVFGICEDGLACRNGTCQPFEIAERGEACDADHVFCGETTICRSDAEGNQVCAAIGWNGDPCTEDVDCAGSTWCGPAGRDQGQVGVCTAPGTEGDACEFGTCIDRLYCGSVSRSGAGTCEPKLERGTECDSDEACAEELVCVWNSMTREKTCREAGGDGDGSTEACRF